MGQNETKEKQDTQKKETINSPKEEGNEIHMIEILKKENELLKSKLKSLNTSNNYTTLLSMLEVLNMQREKILSIKNGKYIYNI